ncbi:uncharacterized protein LOC141525739 [Cotesia typhae]|uniref:uncharacterized protein LOC141525739 n=1 Tax=Cotesia typhae TaxID=2053667 RepID=UPI003D687836
MSLSYNNIENEELLIQSFKSLFPDLFSTVSSQLPPTSKSISTEKPVIMQSYNSASEIDSHQSVEKSKTFNKNPSCSKRRTRTVFKDNQLLHMEQIYTQSNYLCRQKRIDLAESLGLTEKQITVWFQNRRMKDKKIGSKKRVKDSNLVLGSYSGVCDKTNVAINHVQDSSYPIYNVQCNSIPATTECPTENYVRPTNFNNCSSESANYLQFQNWNSYNQYQTNVIQNQNYNSTYGTDINYNHDNQSSTANSNFYNYSSCNYQQYYNHNEQMNQFDVQRARREENSNHYHFTL